MTSGRILAASFLRNMFGNKAERALSVFVALSVFGNVLSVIFSQGRRKSPHFLQLSSIQSIDVNESCPRDRTRRHPPFFSPLGQQQPFNAPFMGLLEHWIVSVIIMLGAPPGDAYNFILK